MIKKRNKCLEWRGKFFRAEKYAINMDKDWCDEDVLLDFTKDFSHINQSGKETMMFGRVLSMILSGV